MILLLLVFTLIIQTGLDSTRNGPKALRGVTRLVIRVLSGVMGKDVKGGKLTFQGCVKSLFLFLVITGLSKLLKLQPPATSCNMALPLKLVAFILVRFGGVGCGGVRTFANLFGPLPFLFPVGLVKRVTTPFSVSLHLFKGILSNAMVVKLVCNLLCGVT